MMALHLDIFVFIAKESLAAYRSMLAVPRFARYTLEHNIEFRRHFTVQSINPGKYEEVCYYLNKMLHREDDLPAVKCSSGVLRWYKYGKLYRDDDKPIEEYPDIFKQWGYIPPGENFVVPHRIGKPAYIITCSRRRDIRHYIRKFTTTGEFKIPIHIAKKWFQHGKPYREDNLPVMEYSYGKKLWYYQNRYIKCDPNTYEKLNRPSNQHYDSMDDSDD